MRVHNFSSKDAATPSLASNDRNLLNIPFPGAFTRPSLRRDGAVRSPSIQSIVYLSRHSVTGVQRDCHERPTIAPNESIIQLLQGQLTGCHECIAAHITTAVRMTLLHLHSRNLQVIGRIEDRWYDRHISQHDAVP